MPEIIIIGGVIAGSVLAAVIAAYSMKRATDKSSYKAEAVEPVTVRRMGFYEKYVKRAFDVMCAVGAIAVFFPVYLVIGFLVKIKLGSPVLFTQDRPGLIGPDGKENIFKMYKFRSMTDETDENGELLPDDVRLTEFGVWLRNTSLDELPQVFNILNGTMSVIGPRPQLVRDMVFMTKEQRRRHTAKPGLSGLAQVNGRNAISWEDKIAWDLKYIEKVSIFRDVRIVADTVKKALIKQESITQKDMGTVEDLGDYLLRMGKIDKEEYMKKQMFAKDIEANNSGSNKKLIALLNCHEDDVYCFRREIIEALVENGYRVLISCPEGHRLACFRNKPDIIIENISIDRRGKNPVNDGKLLLDYVALFRKYQPSLVCTFTIKPNIYGSIAADILRIPHVNTITGLGSGYQNGGPVQNIVIEMYKLALRKSRKIFFQNEENMRLAADLGMLRRGVLYECIPGSGVNLERFHYVKRADDSDHIVFNYIGRVLKDKRIDDYLEAAKIIRNRHSQTRFNIIGFIEPDETYYAELLNNLEKDGIIHYCGSVDDVRPYINDSDAIIHPSSYGEGMSNVLLETAASGRAVITTDIAGCRETVDDGISGYIYPAEDVEQLVMAIEKFLKLSAEERIQMGLAGRKKVEKLFDRKTVVKKYLDEVYNRKESNQ